MKVNNIISRNQTHILVEFKDGSTHKIKIPPTIDLLEEVKIRRHKIQMGKYVYNPKSQTWDKISRILLFLQSIVEAIRNIFSK